MSPKTCIFECSTATYLECIQKNLFASNLPWPIQANEGDFCFLYHYELSALFGLWQATANGGRNLVPRAWGGRFPFQVRVRLITPSIPEFPKSTVPETLLNPETGKFNNILTPDQGDTLFRLIHSPAGGLRPPGGYPEATLRLYGSQPVATPKPP